MRLIRLLLALAISLPVLLQGQTCDVMQYRRTQVSPHVYLFQSAEGTPGVVNSNIVAVVGKQAILLVDAGQFAGATRRVLNELRTVSPLPVRYLVNTHWHGDHLLGNSAVKEAFPSVEIIAHSHTVSEADSKYAKYQENVARFPQQVADLRKRLEASTDAEEQLWMKTTLACADLAYPEMKSTQYIPATKKVDDRLAVDLGGVQAVIQYLGVGNTPGDLVVLVPRDKLVATGDMVVAPSPYAIGSDLAPWPGTLDRLLQLGATTYIPGHGPVFRSDTYIRDLRELFKNTRAQFETLQQSGVPKNDVASKLDTHAFTDKYIDTPMKRQAFKQFFVRSAIAKFWSNVPAAGK